MSNSFKFAHLADCHLDSWREPVLKQTNLLAFQEAMDWCIKENVDFVLISGDLFHSCTPDMEILRVATKKMKEVRDAKIPIYVIAGSHDFSQSDKTIIRVLEAAGLFTNVAKAEERDEHLFLKFTTDEKTGAKITGMPGKKGGLERRYYDALDLGSLETTDGFKIFMFHSAIEEYKPRFLAAVEGIPLSCFPKNFNYYAGGHVHTIFEKNESGYGKFVFPGALYPVNFRELEHERRGNFMEVSVEDGKVSTRYIPIEPHIVTTIRIDATGKSAESLEQNMSEELKEATLADRIVLLRVYGKLSSGNVRDVDFMKAMEIAEGGGAMIFKKNTFMLEDREFEEVQIEDSLNLQELESKLLREHLGKNDIGMNEELLARELMACLDLEKQEGETNNAFEEKVCNLGERALGIWKEDD